MRGGDVPVETEAVGATGSVPIATLAVEAGVAELADATDSKSVAP